MNNQFAAMPLASDAGVATRADFITKTYAHLMGAVGLWVFLLFALFQTSFAPKLAGTMLGGRWSWLIVLGVYMVVSMIANKWAMSATSLPTQYAGLGLYVFANAIITFPLVYIAANAFPAEAAVLPKAAGITLALFTGLTAIVFVTRNDFSFMRGALMLGGLVAMGLIVCSILFGFNLGVFFSIGMIALMCGYILYDTSNVLHHYRIGQHVAASLALFASLATLFWYVLQLVMSMSGDD